MRQVLMLLALSFVTLTGRAASAAPISVPCDRGQIEVNVVSGRSIRITLANIASLINLRQEILMNRTGSFFSGYTFVSEPFRDEAGQIVSLAATVDITYAVPSLTTLSAVFYANDGLVSKAHVCEFSN